MEGDVDLQQYKLEREGDDENTTQLVIYRPRNACWHSLWLVWYDVGAV